MCRTLFSPIFSCGGSALRSKEYPPALPKPSDAINPMSSEPSIVNSQNIKNRYFCLTILRQFWVHSYYFLESILGTTVFFISFVDFFGGIFDHYLTIDL